MASQAISDEAFYQLVDTVHKIVHMAVERKQPEMAPTPTPNASVISIDVRKVG